jgi:uncharacterized protein YndB with AHSA1/START domain
MVAVFEREMSAAGYPSGAITSSGSARSGQKPIFRAVSDDTCGDLIRIQQVWQPGKGHRYVYMRRVALGALPRGDRPMVETQQIEPGKQEIILAQVFDAPRELVWRACTDPDLVSQWWGPRNLKTTVEKMDARPGGLWRIVQRDAEGNEYAFHGVFHEVTEPERLIYTFEYEGMPGHVLLEMDTFDDLEDRTRMTTHLVFQSVEDRDAMLQQSGMREEMEETMDLLAELLASQRSAAPAR